MKKDQNIEAESQDTELKEPIVEGKNNKKQQGTSEKLEEIQEITPEEKIKELEDKLVRTFAEMENQRRRFEKEREDAFNYGGFAFAKETLNLIDNLERSKQILEDRKSVV